MKKILIIGMNPRIIGFSNPELPPGLSIEIIEKGTNANTTKTILKDIGLSARFMVWV